jgi:transcription-repair coupling factor (superfamily II helicase)
MSLTPRSLFVPELGSGAALDHLLQSVKQLSTIDLFGAKGGSLALFLVRFQAVTTRPVVIITKSASEARLLYSDVLHHLVAEGTGEEAAVLHYPAFDIGPYSELVAERTHAMMRAGAVFRLLDPHKWRFLIADIDSVARRLVPRDRFEALSIRIETGNRIDREALITRLEQGRYYRTALVEEMGTYAARGSLIDVYPPYLSAPIRIDLWGLEVENLRVFDPETQAGGEARSSVSIHPCQLNFMPQDAASKNSIADRLREVCDQVDQPTTKTTQLLDDILGDRPIMGIDRFFPAFYPTSGRLFDYLPDNAVLCWVDPSGVMSAHRKAWLSSENEYARQAEAGIPAFSPRHHLLTPSEVDQLMSAKQRILVHDLAVYEGEAHPEEAAVNSAADLNAEGTESLFERLRNQIAAEKSFEMMALFVKYLAKLERCGYRTAVVTHTPGQAERLAGMLRGRGLKPSTGSTPCTLRRPGLIVTPGELARGCILPGDGLAWIAEEEVFGRRTRRSKHQKGSSPHAALSDLKSLRPGDLVVHAEHGIGKYEGLIRQQVRNAEMDFLLLTYRDGDKLYLPVYRLNQIQKYRGGGPEQRLDKLGGQTFSQSLAKAKKATEEMAVRLLALYAERSTSTRTPFLGEDELYQEFEAAFPFEETDDQARAIDETMADLSGENPMDRLICGDVGFGKTEVAMRAAFRGAMSGYQTAVLVPTTVLAQQHYQTFSARFAPYPVNVDMLSRFRTAKENRATVLSVKEGRTDVIIGTHRLLSKDVHFKNLGLLVIDEEHRFGVTHKERIRSLRTTVDTLVLTATPIPRTLQMAFGGIRALSLITTAPAARRPIKTMICHDDPEIIRRAIVSELERRGQVFFVHNRVRDIRSVAERVQRMVPEARVAVGHGQMKESTLERIMLDFVAGKYDILVCTAIIESGLDIPRANTIIIDRADMFGVAQLYQLRGRVGRSSKQAYAYLIVPPLSVLGDDAKQRVETLTRYTNLGSGFSVATMDLELRGAGNLIGAEQSGNVAAVGLEMFCDLLEKAVSELKGVPVGKQMEPELTLEQPGYIPEAYIPDVGQRLQMYKQLASAATEIEVEKLAAEMTDRFGLLPKETESLISGMVAKAICRRLKISGLEVTQGGLSLHLTPDTTISPDTIVDIVKKSEGRVRLTPELVVKARFEPSEAGGVGSAIHFLHRIEAYGNNLSIS